MSLKCNETGLLALWLIGSVHRAVSWKSAQLFKNPLRIVFLHYHLKPGGVTTVLKQQVAVLRGTCDLLVLASHGCADAIGTGVIPVPIAAYDEEVKENVTPGQLANALLKAIKQKWPRGCDLLHVHNPCLAKNRKLLEALEILRDNGIPMFLQIHDFAEDGRPDVYYDRDYPADVHYGVINSRDYEILMEAGLKPEGLHLIENQVSSFNSGTENKVEDGYVLYPVRALRRKNIGETLLLSLFLKKEQTVGLTLPPNSISDRESYEKWLAFAGTYDFNVKFGVGLMENFPELVRKARFFITTSLNEGFGFAFLEPWTAGKMVLGRSLHHVCRDFKRHGVNLNHLYDALYIPISCIDKEAFYDKWQRSFIQMAHAFNYHIENGELHGAFDNITKNHAIDFGILDEGSQMQTLLEIKSSRKCNAMVRNLNPWLDSLHSPGITRELIAHNRERILDYYGKENYRKRLLGIYERVVSVPVTQRIQKDILLRKFFNPAEYKMLR
jgi:hypothetical protein